MSASAYLDTFARDNLPPPAQWPQLLFELPELQYADRLNCVVELLDRMAVGEQAQRPAIHSHQGVWTYAQLLAKVNQIAHVLRTDMRLVPGNRVLLRGANNPMMAACWLATLKAGLIAVPTMPLLRAKELTVILDKAQVTAALCADDLRAELDAARSGAPQLAQVVYFNGSDGAPTALEQLMAAKPTVFSACDTAADDIALIAFTSGTTGKPKGTMHTHRDVLAICDCFPRSILRSQADDIFIGTPPLAFTFGLGGLLLFPLRVGAATVLLEKMTPETLLKNIQDFHATICFTAPTFYRQMAPLAAKYDLSSLKKTVSAGEALPLATRELWRQATGLAMIDGIGATELLHIFISAAGDDIRPGATGKPIPGSTWNANASPDGDTRPSRLATRLPLATVQRLRAASHHAAPDRWPPAH